MPVAEARRDRPVRVLAVRDVAKCYGARRALDGVSLQVEAGQVYGLLGPNGAGKTTLISMVAGLLRPDTGRIDVAGVDVVADPRSARTLVGVAPQDTALYEVLTVRENLAFFAELGGFRRRERSRRVDEVAVALRLTGLLDRTAFRLSGGERRRLHAAIAFLHRPPLLLLDEVTVGADIETRAALLDVVRSAANDGAALLYSTHYLPEIETLRATVGILVDGRVIATGSLEALVAAHARPAVEFTFASSAPAVDLPSYCVRVDGSVLRVETPDPVHALPDVMQRLGAHANELRAVELIRPSLDSVYLALTGRRFTPEGADVAAA